MENDKITEIALNALNVIANPIQHFKALAEAEGTKLNGLAAILLGKDHNWLRAQAKTALEQIAELQAVGVVLKDRSGARVYSGTLDAMFFTHTEIVSSMMLDGDEINRVTRVQTKLPLRATVGFKGEVAKLIVLTTIGDPAATAVIHLNQDLKDLCLASDCAGAVVIQGALSCHHCQYKHETACGDPRACKAAHEYGQYRSCIGYQPNDECLSVLVRVVREWAARSGERVP